MATVQAYTKSGVDAKFNSRSNMTMVHNGGGSPDISAYPDSKTGDVIERSSDGARWSVVASTINPIAGRVVSVAGKTGLVTLGPGDVGAAPTSHTHTKAQITDLNASTSATANSIAQRGTGGVLVVGTPTATTHATTKAYVDSQVTGGITWANLSGKPSTFPPSAHTHTVSQITDLTLSTTATANSVAQRDSSGRVAVATPTLSGHATTKSYVDAVISASKAWSAITGKPSTYTPSTHTHTQGEVTGLSAKLNALEDSSNKITTSTSNISGTTTHAGYLLSLSTSGRLTTVSPIASGDVANKGYVDSEISAKTTWANTSGKPSIFPPSSHTHTKSQITDLNATTAATGSSIVQRDSIGRVTVGTPAATGHATTKTYVDNAVAAVKSSSASLSHTHTKAQITDLNASTSATANSIAQRDTRGVLVVGTPTATAHATTKGYVDRKFISNSVSTDNLNDITTPGFYRQGVSGNVRDDLNYPTGARIGHLVVVGRNNDLKQEYTNYNSGAMFYRTKQGSTWYPWQVISQSPA